VHLDIYEMTTTPQLAALHDKTIDIGLLREPPADETQLGFKTVLTERFVAVLPSAHPITAQRAVQIGQLANSPFVLLPRQVGPRLHDLIIGLCEARSTRRPCWGDHNSVSHGTLPDGTALRCQDEPVRYIAVG
jgi:DNA-binding transcriptional LysR family regulator